MRGFYTEIIVDHLTETAVDSQVRIKNNQKTKIGGGPRAEVGRSNTVEKIRVEVVQEKRQSNVDISFQPVVVVTHRADNFVEVASCVSSHFFLRKTRPSFFNMIKPISSDLHNTSPKLTHHPPYNQHKGRRVAVGIQTHLFFCFLLRRGLVVGLDSRNNSHEMVLVVIKVPTATNLGVVQLVRCDVLDLKGASGPRCGKAIHLKALDVRFQNCLHLLEAGEVPSGTTVRDVDLERRHNFSLQLGLFLPTRSFAGVK